MRVCHYQGCVNGACLFFMGSGWDDHFSLRYEDDRLMFQVTSDRSSGSWDKRVDITTRMRIGREMK